MSPDSPPALPLRLECVDDDRDMADTANKTAAGSQHRVFFVFAEASSQKTVAASKADTPLSEQTFCTCSRIVGPCRIGKAAFVYCRN